jgi:Rrf2 family protein
MLYSSAAEYAIRALTQLALNEIEFGQPKPSPVKELAEREGIPQHFLGKVFQTLVRAGILSSMRGPHGGFALARPASHITLYEIVQAIDGTAALDRCVIGLPRCSDRNPCPHHARWKPVRDQIKDYLRGTTLADLAQAVQIHHSSEGGDAQCHAEA